MFRTAHEIVLEAKKSVTECSPEEIQKRIEQGGSLIIDVREPDEYRQGFLAGAINIPRGLLEFKITADATLQDLDRSVIVYCKTSGRAALSVAALQSMGFRHVISMAGGFDAWSAEGREVVKPAHVNFD